MNRAWWLLIVAMAWSPAAAWALDYPYQTDEPQKTGWPLSDEERAYVLRPEHERRPGAEVRKHLPAMWPVCPSAGHFGGTSWLDTHARLVAHVEAHRGPIDILLVGDSITQQWGSPLDTGNFNDAWQRHFGQYRAVNLGIGGDKTQNVLWRLDHGGVDGLEPKAILLMIGNNNMFFTPETGIEAVAQGIEMCVKNLREKFPDSTIVVAKILPAHAPGHRFYEDIRKTNAALDPLKLDGDPGVRVLDLTADFTQSDGTLKKELFTPDNIHLSPAGYAVYAERLKPLVNEALLADQQRGALGPAAFLRRNCVECHDAATREAGLDLTALGPDLGDPTGFRTWVKVHDRIAAGKMPPREARQPTAADRDAFLAELDGRLTEFDRALQRRSGRVRLRRLTRVEFENTLRDLLALPHLEIQGLLPADGRVAGYDKIAAGLDLSPAHLQGYQDAVEQALDAAIATRGTPPPVFQRRIYPAGLFKFEANLLQGQFVLLKDKQPDPDLPVRGGLAERQGYVGDQGPDLDERRGRLAAVVASRSQSAVGLLNPNLAGYEAAMNVAPIYAGRYRIRISLWGFHWNQGRPEHCAAPQAAALRAHEEGKQQEGGRLLSLLTAPSLQSHEVELVPWLNARESLVFDPVSIPWNGLRIGQVAGRAAKHVGPGVALDWFEIEGPLHASWPPESHRRLFGDLPIENWPEGTDRLPPRRTEVRGLGGYLPNFYVDIPPRERRPPLETVRSSAPEEDARRLLAAFLPRAFRRDVAPDELEPYLALLESRLAAKDCFEDAMRRVYVAVLTSPEFLFHPADAPDATAFVLASRLSYWLWNGPPDDALLAAARDGSLTRTEVLHAEVDRLLADDRSQRFIEDFTNQWLELRRIDETTPDPRLYPEYRFLMHQGMLAETRAFVRELIQHDLPARALLKPGFAMLTQRLAEHYGIDGVQGVEVRKVPLPAGSVRGGLLGHASIHKLTANGTTTTPVKRGVWVMDRLLDDPAPPPPPGISAIDPDTRGATTIREQLDRHRADAACAACHAKIDPPGFALEAFDPIGGFRDRYRSNGQGEVPPEQGRTAWRVTYKLGPKVDPSGRLPDGSEFHGPEDYIDQLVRDEAGLARAFAAHLARYATGADVSYADRAELRRLVERTQASGHGLRSLIHALAESPLLFPMDR